MTSHGQQPPRATLQSLVNRLRGLGIDARLMKGQRCVLGSVNLSNAPFATPVGDCRVDKVLFATMGIDRIKCLRPQFLSQLPPIHILSCTRAHDVEARIRDAWERHVRTIRDTRGWLEDMGINPSLAEDGSYLTFPVDGENVEAHAAMTDRRRVILPSTGKLRGLTLGTPAERVMQIDSHVTTGVDLAIQISTRTEEVFRRAEEREERRRYAAMLENPHQGEMELVGRRSHTILLVGSHLIQHQPSIESLRLRGYRVITAKNEKEAVDAFGHASPELVITEMNLGRSEGLDLILSLRDVFGIEKLPIILVDQSKHQAKRDAARSLGAAAYLIAPLDIPRIADRLANLVEVPGRRRFTRYPGRMSVNLPGAANAALLTALSRGGMFVTTSQTIPANTVHKFELRLPGFGKSLNVQAEAIYHLAGAGRSLSGVGMRFHEFAGSHEAILIEYLRNLDAG
jgi:CheY-like chemotaxis protein